jgi:hypothetical protein
MPKDGYATALGGPPEEDRYHCFIVSSPEDRRGQHGRPEGSYVGCSTVASVSVQFDMTPPGLLPRCYQTTPNHADPRRTASVPSVEIFELYIVVDLGGKALGITLNQRVQGSSP